MRKKRTTTCDNNNTTFKESCNRERCNANDVQGAHGVANNIRETRVGHSWPAWPGAWCGTTGENMSSKRPGNKSALAVDSLALETPAAETTGNRSITEERGATNAAHPAEPGTASSEPGVALGFRQNRKSTKKREKQGRQNKSQYCLGWSAHSGTSKGQCNH